MPARRIPLSRLAALGLLLQTLTMRAGIGGIIVLLRYRRPGSSPGEDDGRLEREGRAAPAAATA